MISQNDANLKKATVIRLLKAKGVLRPKDMDAVGISRVYLNKLFHQGILDRPGRGIYTLPDSELTENQTLLEAVKKVPAATVCLLSALQFHGLTTQIPFEIWLAIDHKARQPKIEYPPIRFVRFSGPSLTYGYEQHRVSSNSVRVFSPAKTIADCFKFRNKIGLDVALEALRDCLQQKKATTDQLWQAAKVCRMSNVMRPYLESMSCCS